MIHIWLPNTQATPRLWQETTQTWQTVENWQEIVTLASLQHNKTALKQACLYFPSIYLLKTQPNLSSAQLKSLGDTGRKYLFEDISIAPIDDLQLKIEPTHSASDFPNLFAIHAADREQWEHAASLAGIDIIALLPDFLLLPTIASASASSTPAVFYQDKQTQLLKINPQHGLAISYLPIVLSKMPQIEEVYLIGQLDPSLQQQLATLTTINFQSSELTPQPIKDPTRHLLNFATVKTNTTIPPYAKVITLVALSALLMTFIVDGLRWFYYDKAQKQAKALLEQQYSQWFPAEKLDGRLNIQQQLSGKLVTEPTNQSNVLATLSNIQPVLQQYQISARQLNYQDNRIQLQLISSNSDNLNKAVNDLINKGIKAKLGSIDPSTQMNPATVNVSSNPSTGSKPSGLSASVEIEL